MRQMEDRFNHWAQYDYVFLNEEVSKGSSDDSLTLQDFSDEFKQYA